MRNDEGRSLHARLRRRPLARRIRCCNPIAAPCQARSVRATVVLTGCVALLLSRATGVVAGTLLDHRDIGPDTGQDGNFREGRELPVFLEGVSLVLRPNHRGPSSKWFQSWRCITTRPGLGSSESRQGGLYSFLCNLPWRKFSWPGSGSPTVRRQLCCALGRARCFGSVRPHPHDDAADGTRVTQ